MIFAEKQTAYRAFGLRLSSDIALPELIRSNDPPETADVDIRIGRLPDGWDDSLFQHTYYAVKDRQVLFRFPGAADVYVRDGKQIWISPVTEADTDLLRQYVLGSCMGAILLQRQVLPLHGSAVSIGGKAYAFVGESGAGKSTLAAAFVHRGYPLVSDDVIAVSISGDGIPFVTPSYPQQKLWQRSLDGLGMEANRYEPLYQRIHKFAVPVAERFHTEPLPLGGIFELIRTEQETNIRRLQGLQRLPVFRFHTYRGMLVPLLNLERWHFAMTADIANRTDVYRVLRPSSGFTAQAMAETILDTIERKGRVADEQPVY